MPEPKLTLYAESSWMSPWVFHVLVALEEKRVPYEIEVLSFPLPEQRRAEIRGRAIFAKVPILADGETWISESLAISEYLDERFPAPDHPPLLPSDRVQRARARQVLSALRTGFFQLREERQTLSVFGPASPKPMSEKAKAEADELVRFASLLIRPGMTSLFGAWCIADTDLTLALMRLVSNGDPVPQELAEYAAAQWARPSVARFLGHVAQTR